MKTRPGIRLRSAVLPPALLLALCVATEAPRGEAGPNPPSPICSLGITLALGGQGAAAESVFVSMLSRSAGDPRALNNLGNLHLWRGEIEVAMAFYEAAGRSDTADAGIALNGALATLFAGDETGAQGQAEQGVLRAGGIEGAARLLGIPFNEAGTDLGRQGDRVRMTRAQALQLLRSAARAVPPDSTAYSHPHADSTHSVRRVVVWRPAAARGSDASEAPVNVYWKY